METQKQSQAQATRTSKKGMKRSRKWPWVLVGLLVLFLLIVLLIPVVLSSGGFTRWVQAQIGHTTGGEANIGDLSVGWFRGVRVADFRFRGENGWTQVDIDRITAMPRYAGLLTGTLAIGRTVIDQPRIAIDLRERPPHEERPPVDMNNLERLRDVVVRDGRVRLTDTAGNTVQIADLNSNLRIRPPGQTSRFDAGMAVLTAAQPPGRLTAVGEATPRRETGWSLRGTTGDVTVEIDDLNLDAVTPFLEMAGIEVQTQGQISGTLTTAVEDGQFQSLDATVTGQDLAITGEALKGDELHTAQLSVRARLTQSQEVIDVGQLEVRTDWANVSATGRIPKTPGSLSELLESGAAYDVRGQFDVNLAAVLSQMPNTIGVRPGMEITGGRATGEIDTVTEAGRATLVAKAQVTGLTGVVNNEQVRLSQPVQTTVRLSTGAEGAQLDSLNVTAPFAQVDASGTFRQIQYQGRADLEALQSELGAFINLGPYEIAGQMAAQGKLSLGDEVTAVAGSLSARQFVLAAADGNSVGEPQADIDFALAIDRQQQVLTIDTLTANAGFGTLNVERATIPLGADSPAALNAVIVARNVDLSRLEPYGEFFGFLPESLALAGLAQAQVTVERRQNVYRLFSDNARVQNLQVQTPDAEPFRQPQVTAQFDVYLDPNQKTINIESLQVESPQIRIRKGRFTRTSRNDTIQAQGTLDAQLDWAAVSPLASAFVPGQVSIVGQRQVAVNFASTYPADEPNGLLAHLNSEATLGFDRASYFGFDFGPTEMKVRVQNGVMTLGPFSTTVNDGKLSFAGQADFGHPPALLTLPQALHVIQDIQLNEQTTQTFLAYVNPIFADAVRVRGIANFNVQRLAIPLGAGLRNRAALTGTLWIDQLQLGASNILNQILGVVGRSVTGQVLTVRPTTLVLENGIVRYDDMQIEVGDNPINFRGSISLEGVLNLTVALPYTLQGRTVRVGEPQVADRISVPLTGTIAQPQLDLKGLLETQLKERLEEQILKGLEDLLKRR